MKTRKLVRFAAKIRHETDNRTGGARILSAASNPLGSPAII